MNKVFCNKNGGYSVILAVSVLAIIAALWLSTKQGDIVTYFKNKAIEQDFAELKAIKERLLEFAVLTPEMYFGADLTLLSPSIANDRPFGPGYFPCPDNVEDLNSADGVADWATCSTTLGDVLMGKLPRVAANTNDAFYFGPQDSFFYYVDRRFVIPNASDGIFSPLTPSTVDASTSPITLNGAGGYIALIIDPGSDNALNEVSISGTDFTYQVDNPNNPSSDPTVDKVIGIQFSTEWLPLMAKRVCIEQARYLGEAGTGFSKTDSTSFQQDNTVLDDDPNWYFFNGGVSGESWYEWGVDRCP